MITLRAKIHVPSLEKPIEVNMRNMMSVSGTIATRSDLEKPAFGVIANTGNIEFIDKYIELEKKWEIASLLKDGLLTEGLKAEISIGNTIKTGAEQKVGVYETSDWSYDSTNRVVSVGLQDDLIEWQDIAVEKKIWGEPITMYNVLNYLIAITPSKWEFVSHIDTDRYLLGIPFENGYLEADNLWAVWTKFCEACFLNVFKNGDGKIVVRHFV